MASCCTSARAKTTPSQILDTATLEIVGELPSGPDPEVIVISPDGATLYAANEDDNLVTVIDVKSRAVLSEIPVGVEPEGMAVSPDGKTIVNTSETTNMAHFIDAGDARDHRQRPGRPAPARRRVHRRRRRGLGDLGNRRHGQRDRQCDAARSSTRSASRSRACRPSRSSRSGSGSRATAPRRIVALGPANRVAVVDAQTYEVEDYLLVGQRVWQLAFSPDEKFLYTTNGVSNDISVIDVEAEKVTKSVAVGSFPWGVAVKD